MNLLQIVTEFLPETFGEEVSVVRRASQVRKRQICLFDRLRSIMPDDVDELDSLELTGDSMPPDRELPGFLLSRGL